MGIMEGPTNWEDVICPICLDFPHNAVLLQCSSYEKGCRPYMCDTDHSRSNCLDRFKTAYGVMSLINEDDDIAEIVPSTASDENVKPNCPLCRGDVTGWVAVEEARLHLNMKRRCCEEKSCAYVGNYLELQKHASMKHPNARPTEIDPARKLDWEIFQESSEIIDVLSTIHSEMPHGVVLGDYVIEYGDDDTGDEYEEFRGSKSSWWRSCILYQVFGSFRASRNRRRLRAAEIRRGRRRSSYDATNDSSSSSLDIAEFRFDETDDESVPVGGLVAAANRSSWRRRSHFHDL